MFFNSIDFAVFLPIVFVLYWFIFNKNIHRQNLLIVVASYVFYGWWDWRFLILIFISTVVDFWAAKAIHSSSDPLHRKFWLIVSLFVNLSFLAVFKYYNFFIENLITAFSFLGMEMKFNLLNIILPAGISFYTFQTLSYSIDVYRNKLEPTHDFIAFSAFVSFFPQLVAGPIERASHLLPQFLSSRTFNYDSAVNGSKQILWGLFKKMVIADNCAVFVDNIFQNPPYYPGSTMVIGVVLFSFQIYADFSGYSDIAIGTARLFDFKLKRNFAYPYFSRDIAEFWRRWHISLTSWFKDYVYIPLGGSRGTLLNQIRNIFIVFAVSGFWHGAKWTFIVWGLYNALMFVPLLLLNKNRDNIDMVAYNKKLPTFTELFKIGTTYCIVLFGWVFFRADTISAALSIYSKIFSTSIMSMPYFDRWQLALVLFPLLFMFIIMEWIGRRNEYAIEKIFIGKPRLFRWTVYSVIIFTIGMYMKQDGSPFIYFQF